MDELYRDELLDHFEHPRHHGSLADADITSVAQNATCGDSIRVELQLSPDRTRIAAIAFDGAGCIVSQAAASMLADVVIGQSLDEVQNLEQDDVLALIGAPLAVARRKCALLSLRALKLGLYNYLAYGATAR